MFVEAMLLAASAVAALVVTRRWPLSPLALSIWLLAGSLAILIVAPLGITPLSLSAGVIIGVGILSLALPAYVVRRNPNHELAHQGHPSVAFARLIMLSAIVLAMVVVGFNAFVSDISDATNQSFGQLTLTEIRAAQTGSARGGGILALMGATGPVLACLGVYGALRYSVLWLALPALSLWVVLQSPARLNSISLIVVMVVFYLYARIPFTSAGSRIKKEEKKKKKKKKRRVRAALLLVACGVGALAVFNFVGGQLGKTQSALLSFPQYNWPDWTLSPFLYFAGGFSGFSKALQQGFNPFDPGGSYFTIMKIVNALFPSVPVPDTIGHYVGIPAPFNLYTGFGQVYFDLGLGGVILSFGLLGLLAALAHRNALEGRIEWAWISATLASVLASIPQSYILFHLDLDFQLAIGVIAFSFLRRSTKRASVSNVEVRRGRDDLGVPRRAIFGPIGGRMSP